MQCYCQLPEEFSKSSIGVLQGKAGAVEWFGG